VIHERSGIDAWFINDGSLEKTTKTNSFEKVFFFYSEFGVPVFSVGSNIISNCLILVLTK
jgi:hypothetical protein